MLKLFCTAILAVVSVSALAGQITDQSSDRVVVVGNRAQPVQWNHRETIQDAINQARPNGTVIIPSSYAGTECNPIASCNPGSVSVVDWRTASSLDSPGPIGDVTPNTGDFTELSSNQGLSILAPAQPYIVIPPDPTGACIYPVTWIATGAVLLCNLPNNLPFPLQLNFGQGNFALLAVRSPVNNSVGSNCFAAWVAANGDFELCGAAAAASFTATPTTFANALLISGGCSSGTEGTEFAITDSTTNTLGATVTGGGANHVGMHCNGTNWTVYAK